MATKRKIRKKRIKEDQLVTYSLRISQFAQEHFNQVLIGIVGLVVIVAASIFITQTHKSSAANSEKYLGAALALMRQGDVAAAKTSFQDTYDRYSNTRAGTMALFFKAECDLALKNYGEALNSYQAFLKKSNKFPDFEVTATIGESLALESLYRLSEASDMLERLVTTLDHNDPRYANCLYRLAGFNDKLGNSEKAVQYLQKIIDMGAGPYLEEAEVKMAVFKSQKKRG
jgi:tetratricopeptide (TPR) repeat protein